VGITTTRMTPQQPPGFEPSSQQSLFPLEMSTSDPSAMYERTKLPVTRRRIFSRASPGGHLRSDLRDSLTPDLFGQEAAPVSRSALRGEGLEKKTSATSGPCSAISLKSLALQKSLESRLRERLEGIGSPEYALTWRKWDMQSVPPICALQARGHRTSGRAYIGLPTPAAREGRDWSQARILARLDRGGCVARRICRLSPTLRSSEEIVGLNPSFAGWMMGYPEGWICSSAMAMVSSRPRRRSSSSQRARRQQNAP
jgi:hypothetical protein